MAEKLPERPSEEHPIVAGLVALVGVGLAVGLVMGVVVLAGTKVLGIGGDDGDSASNAEASLYLPTPAKTSDASDPQITLAPGEAESSSAPPEESESPESEITLTASAADVGPMQAFQLSGVYPQGEGAILTVQRFEGGQWTDFPATGSVGGETFQISVQTSKAGVNRFRVVDSDTGLESDEVRVTVAG